MITVQAMDQGKLDKAAALLSGINGGLEKALRSAASRSTQHLKTEAGKKARERYALSQSAINGNRSVRVSYNYGHGVEAEVTFTGYRIPLMKYNGASPGQPTFDTSRTVRVLTGNGWIQSHPGVSARGHVLKSTSPKVFEHAFVARFGSGHTGIYERTGGASRTGRDELREIMGLSVPDMLGSKEVSEQLAEDTMAKFDERLDHEITAILNGWR